MHVNGVQHLYEFALPPRLPKAGPEGLESVAVRLPAHVEEAILERGQTLVVVPLEQLDRALPFYPKPVIRLGVRDVRLLRSCFAAGRVGRRVRLVMRCEPVRFVGLNLLIGPRVAPINVRTNGADGPNQ